MAFFAICPSHGMTALGSHRWTSEGSPGLCGLPLPSPASPSTPVPEGTASRTLVWGNGPLSRSFETPSRPHSESRCGAPSMGCGVGRGRDKVGIQEGVVGRQAPGGTLVCPLQGAQAAGVSTCLLSEQQAPGLLVRPQSGIGAGPGWVRRGFGGGGGARGTVDWTGRCLICGSVCVRKWKSMAGSEQI